MANAIPFTSASRYITARRLVVNPARFFSHSFRQLTKSDPFKTRPAPPRLPKEEQEIFERLQRQSTGAFSTPRAPAVNQPAEASSVSEQKTLEINQGEELHPHVRQGARPEFEGDVNPKTGEVGGPKNEPLRWGAESDWSYNGKVTDF